MNAAFGPPSTFSWLEKYKQQLRQSRQAAAQPQSSLSADHPVPPPRRSPKAPRRPAPVAPAPTPARPAPVAPVAPTPSDNPFAKDVFVPPSSNPRVNPFEEDVFDPLKHMNLNESGLTVKATGESPVSLKLTV